MKRFYAINGSPRKTWNTAQLLDKALEGAKAAFPDEEVITERIDLYELSYTGCRSCFACKRKGGPSYGKCAVQDGLQDVLEKVLESDGVIIGSPIYFRNVTGQLHSFFERLLFPYTVYSADRSGIQEKRIPFAFIYTMNVTEDVFTMDHYAPFIGLWEQFAGRFFGSAGHHYAFNTYQFDDYSKYVADIFSEPEKAAYKQKHWEEDCEAAYQLGYQFRTLAE